MTFELNAADSSGLNATRGTEFNARGERISISKEPHDENNNTLTDHQPSYHNVSYTTTRNGGPNMKTREKRIVIVWITTYHTNFNTPTENRRLYLGRRAFTDLRLTRAALATYPGSSAEAFDQNFRVGMGVLMLGQPPDSSGGGNIGSLGFPTTQDDSQVPITQPDYVSLTDLGDVTLNPTKSQIQAIYDDALANLGSGRDEIGDNRTDENNSIDAVVITLSGSPFADAGSAGEANLDAFIVDLKADIGTTQATGTDITKTYLNRTAGTLGSDWMSVLASSINNIFSLSSGRFAPVQICGYEFEKNPVLAAGPGAGNVTITFDDHGWAKKTAQTHAVWLSTSNNPGSGTLSPNFIQVQNGDVLDADSISGIGTGSTIYARVLSWQPTEQGKFLGSTSQFIYLYPQPKSSMEVSNSVVVP